LAVGKARSLFFGAHAMEFGANCSKIAHQP
jgi:hypothetical protein